MVRLGGATVGVQNLPTPSRAWARVFYHQGATWRGCAANQILALGPD